MQPELLEVIRLEGYEVGIAISIPTRKNYKLENLNKKATMKKTLIWTGLLVLAALFGFLGIA